jgi:hypothetical protein
VTDADIAQFGDLLVHLRRRAEQGAVARTYLIASASLISRSADGLSIAGSIVKSGGL